MKKKNGQIILEVLISAALFSLVAFSIAVIAKDVVDACIKEIRKIEGVYLAREGIEAIRAIAKANFEDLENGIFGVKEESGQWEIVKGAQKIRDFFRRISISSSPFEKTKKIKVEVSFKDEKFRPKNSIVLSGYLTKNKIYALELNSSSYIEGNPSPWQASSWTLLFFVKPKTLSQIEGAGLFSNQDTSKNPKESGFLEVNFDGTSNYQIRINDNIFPLGEIKDKWTFLAIVFDGSHLKAYLDGKNSFNQSLHPNQGIGLFKTYLLGISSDKKKSFQGYYKNLMIFERALSEKEISDLFEGILPSFEGLRLYWKMEEGKGNLVKDFSPSDVSGNIIGLPLWKEAFVVSSWKEVSDF